MFCFRQIMGAQLISLDRVVKWIVVQIGSSLFRKLLVNGAHAENGETLQKSRHFWVHSYEIIEHIRV